MICTGGLSIARTRLRVIGLALLAIPLLAVALLDEVRAEALYSGWRVLCSVDSMTDEQTCLLESQGTHKGNHFSRIQRQARPPVYPN